LRERFKVLKSVAIKRSTVSPGHVACMGENTYRILVGKLEGKRPLGRLRRKWEDNIKTDFRGVERGGMDCNLLAQDRDKCRAPVNTAMNLRVL
jgi:hypothetical protein